MTVSHKHGPGGAYVGSAASRSAASLRTSAATRSFNSAIVPILCPQDLQQMRESSSAPRPKSKLFRPHWAQFNSMRIAQPAT